MAQTTEMTSRPIGREKVQGILEEAGRGSEYLEAQDYYLCRDADGREWIQEWGQDEALIENHTNTSWA